MVVTVLSIGGSLVAALLINYFVLPGNNLVSSLYAVPVLAGALRLGPRSVAALDALAIVIYLISAYYKNRPLLVQPFGVLALLIVGVLAVLLSEERQRTQRRALEAEEARQRLQNFVGMVSHELKQPMTSVLGYAQLLARLGQEHHTDTERRALTNLNESAQRMQRLLRDLQDAAHIGAGRFEVIPAPTDLVSIVRKAIQTQSATSPSSRIVLQAPEQLDANLDGDRISQLLINLLSNAVKYSPDGSEVRVTVRRVGGEAVVAVSDRGAGISHEQQQLLFQPFSRLQRDRTAPGTGLGLYISRAVAEAHGGRIWVESEANTGSTFTVALPASEDRADVTMPNHARASQSSATQ